MYQNDIYVMSFFVEMILYFLTENVSVGNKWAEQGTINSILVFTLQSTQWLTKPLIEESLKAVLVNNRPVEMAAPQKNKPATFVFIVWLMVIH